MKTFDIVRMKSAFIDHRLQGKLAMIVKTARNTDNPTIQFQSYAIQFIDIEEGITWCCDADLTYVTSVGELIDRGAK